MEKIDFISGERFQQLCSVYFGEHDDFAYNPLILQEKHKHKYISRFNEPYYNPKLVFCYTHRVPELVQKLHLFKNKFVLISHNSDYNITEKDTHFLQNEIIIHWFSQNVNVLHPKLTCIPIGIANRCWSHGNYSNWDNLSILPNESKKDFYFYFSINTNVDKRLNCKTVLESKGLKFWNNMPHPYYLDNMSRYCKYSICPEGNGIDSHRVWESLYTNTIPVCLRSVHTEILSNQYPMVLLDKWEDFTLEITEPSIKIDKLKLSFSYYTKRINEILRMNM